MEEQNVGVSGHSDIQVHSSSLWLPGTMCAGFTEILWNSLVGVTRQVHRMSRMILRWPNGHLQLLNVFMPGNVRFSAERAKHCL